MQEIYIWDFVDINSRSFRGFCVLWAVGGSNIGQKSSGGLTKNSPARQTILGISLASPLGKINFRQTHPTKNVVFATTCLWLVGLV